jgi:hypothetical protein
MAVFAQITRTGRTRNQRRRPLMRIITLLFSAEIAENILLAEIAGYNLRRKCGDYTSMNSKTGPDSTGARTR